MISFPGRLWPLTRLLAGLAIGGDLLYGRKAVLRTAGRPRRRPYINTFWCLSYFDSLVARYVPRPIMMAPVTVR